MTDKLHLWEKWPIGAVFTAQGLYVFAWYVGKQMPAEVTAFLPWLYVVGGVAAWLAIDGSMIATVMGMRAGRRSVWSVAAIVITAAFGAGLALDLYSALPTDAESGAAWLHAGFALTIVCYLMHLAAPKSGERVADLKTAVAQLTADVAHAAQQVAQADARVADALARVAQAEAQSGTATAEAEQRAAQARRDLDAARRELARRPQEDGAAWIVYNGQRVTLAQLVEATGTSSSTLRRKLAQVVSTTAQAAD